MSFRERVAATVSLLGRLVTTLAKAAPGFAEQLFWFLVLVSWLPIVVGFTGFADNFIPGRWGPVDPTHWFAIPHQHYFIFVALAIAALALCLGQWRHLAFAITPLLANYFYQAGPPSPPYSAGFNLSVAYLLAFVVSFALYAWWGRFRSPALFVFLSICVWDTAVHLATDLWNLVAPLIITVDSNVPMPARPSATVLPLLLQNYTAAESDFVIFVACLVFARFLALLYQENIMLVKRLLTFGRRALVKDYLWPAFRLWCPMLGVFLLFSVWIYPGVTDYYSVEVAKIIRDDLLSKNYTEAKTDGPQLEPMMKHLIEYNRRETIRQATAAIATIEWGAVKGVEDLDKYVYPKLEKEIFPPRMPGTHIRGCGRINVPCLAGNGAKSVANSGYRRLRDPPLAATKRAIVQIHKDVQGNSAQLATRANVEIKKQVDAFAANTRFVFNRALYAGRMLSLILLVYSIVVLVKTFGIVLARHVFHLHNPHQSVARLSNEDISPQRRALRRRRNVPGLSPSASPAVTSVDPLRPIESKVGNFANEMHLAKTAGLNYYLVQNVTVANGLPTPWVPFPGLAILTRLRWRKYFIGHLDVGRGSYDQATVAVESPNVLVWWRIAPEERVVFRFEDLVGFSDGVRLKTHISFSLQSLVFGRVIFHTAIGRGILILQTPPNPVLGAAGQAREARDAETLISWHSRTPFQIHSDLTYGGVFIRGYNVEKQAQGRVVYTALSTGGGTNRLGIIRWVRTFLSPF